MVQRRPPDRLPGYLSWVLFSVLLLTTGFIVLGQVTTIRNDLQAQYYSEFSRIFDASLIFGKKVYGQITPWPLLDPGRAILDSVVYLLPEPSLLAFPRLERYFMDCYTLVYSAKSG